MTFVPIHNHSEYSPLDGLATITEIADRVEELGCPCCGLSDHHTVAGHLEFGKVMEKRGIKPIYACEVYHGIKTEFKRQERDQNHLILGALTSKGLQNLWALIDASNDNFRFVSRVNYDLMRKFREGVFATTACALGIVAKTIVHEDYSHLYELLDIYGDDLYMEIHTYPADKAFREGADGAEMNQRIINEAKVQFAEEHGIPLLYADDAHRARKDQYVEHDAYIAMKSGDSIYTPVSQRKMWHPEDALFIRSESEIRESLNYLPQWAVDDAIRNSVDLGERVDAQLPEVHRHLPSFPVKNCPWLPDDKKHLSSDELFVDLVTEGIQERYGDNPSQEVIDRAKREMEVLLDESEGIKLYDYFLMGWDLMQYCQANDIETGPGRGSSAGAITAYALGITDVDPLPYDLIFERFWNAGRAKGFPDIDMDFPRARRRDILHYLEDRWGKDRVRTIGTIMALKPKAAIDKTYKACAVTEQEAKELKRIVNEVPDLEIHGVDQIGWAEETEPGKTIYVMDHVGDKIIEWLESKDERRQGILVNWVWLLQRLCSRKAGYGMHPSGIVVSDVDLPDQLPCRWNKDEQLRVTMFDMEDVDNRQFVKLDVLGLRTLDTLGEWRKLMAEKGIEVVWSGLEWVEHPIEMWQMFDKGLTVGLFQVEDKPAVRRLVKEFKPRSVEDLSIIVALNRPGPLRAAAGEEESTAQKFVKRKTGEQEVTYPHEFLTDTLKSSYGLFLYQEQVIRFFSEMGYDLGDADAVRKILGKKKPEEMVKVKTGKDEWAGKGYMTVAPRFVNGKAETIWNTIEGFASYSFNKSHSVAYGTILFRTTVAKFYGTVEWFVSTIRTDEDRVGVHVAEARRMGIDVLGPDILLSQARVAETGDNTIRYGFGDIKHIGPESAQYIVALREKYGEGVRTRAGLEAALESEKVLWKERQKAAKIAGEPFEEKSPAQTLQSNKIDALEAAGGFDQYEDRIVSMGQRQELEQELLGVILSDDSVEVLEAAVADLDDDLDTYEEMNAPYTEDMKFKVPGVITVIDPKKTVAEGKDMAIVTIEYQGEERDFAVFPKQWKSHKWLFKERTPGIFTIRHALNKNKGTTGYNFDSGIKIT